MGWRRNQKAGLKGKRRSRKTSFFAQSPTGPRRPDTAIDQTIEVPYGQSPVTGWQKIGTYEHEHDGHRYTGRNRHAS